MDWTSRQAVGRLAALLLAMSALVGGVAEATEREPATEALEPPRLRGDIDVVYPPGLLESAAPPEGYVEVRFRIEADGSVSHVTIVRGLEPEIDEAVVSAISGARFDPAIWRGTPVPIDTSVSIDIRPPARAATEVDAPPSIAPPERAPPPELDPPPRSDAPTASTERGRLRGRVLRSGDRAPLGGMTVTLSGALERPSARVERTAEDGSFSFVDVPPGPLEIAVLGPGVERRRFEETIGPDEDLQVRYFVPQDRPDAYRTVVEVDALREEVARRSLTPEAIRTLPGNQGDVLRALQALPGVSRPPLGAGLIVVRGSAPFDTAVLVGDHVITFLFHFGALSTALPSEAIASVDFIPGNFDARYGNHLGGVVRVTPRKGRTDGFHGHAEVDLLDVGFHLEGPLGNGSFLIAARRSLVDLLLTPFVPDDAGLTFTRAPRYYDYQGFVNYPLGPGELAVRAFGADDRAAFVQASAADEEVDVRDRSATHARFHRADLEYRVDGARFRFYVSPSYRFERAEVTNADFFRFDVTRHNLSLRAEFGAHIGPRVDLELGTETIASWYGLRGTAPANFDFGVGVESPGEPVVTTSDDFKIFTAVYATTVLGVGTPVRFVPGVRVTRYGRPMDRTTVDPRLRAAFDVTPRTTVRAAVGLYAQEPAITQQDPVFGNPNLRAERGLHTSVEVERRLPYGIVLSLVGFYKELWDRIAPTSELTRTPAGIEPLREDNTARSRIWGGEVLLQVPPAAGPWTGWLSYTLQWSRTSDRPGEAPYPADFVQRHVLNAVFGVRLPHRWGLGARFQVTSGAPFTPVRGGAFDATTGTHHPIEGPRNSEMLPWFHQLSVRVEKRWVWNWASATAYLDLQNVYNHTPVEAYAYGYDYRQQAPVGGLPIVPWLGARLDF